jgi:hypothetical protein
MRAGWRLPWISLPVRNRALDLAAHLFGRPCRHSRLRRHREPGADQYLASVCRFDLAARDQRADLQPSGIERRFLLSKRCAANSVRLVLQCR